MGIRGKNVIAIMTGGALIGKYIPPPRDDLESLMMKNSPASILAEYIVTTLQLLTSPDLDEQWPCFISSMPDDGVPDNCGTVYDVPGRLDGSMNRTGAVVQHYGVQIKIRSIDYNTGWRRIEDIALALDQMLDASVVRKDTNYIIYNAMRMTPVIPLGAEPGTKRRWLFTVTFTLTMDELES